MCVVQGVSLDSKATFKGPFMPPPHPRPHTVLPLSVGHVVGTVGKV